MRATLRRTLRLAKWAMLAVVYRLVLSGSDRVALQGTH